MRRFVLAALLLLAGTAGAAATEPQKLAPGQSLRGHFDQQRYLKGFAKPLHSTGSFVRAGGTGLIWRGETPFQNVTVLSAAGILQSADGKETMHLAASRMPMLGRFYQVLNGALSGDADALTQDFKLARQDGGEGWQLILTPMRPDDPILGVPLQNLILDPTKLLTAALSNQTISRMVVVNIATTASVLQQQPAPGPGAPPPPKNILAGFNGGGGVENIPFLQTNADAATVFATFWIETIKGATPDDDFMQLQYVQTVFLNFPVLNSPAPQKPLSWPHVSVATLQKTFGGQ